MRVENRGRSFLLRCFVVGLWFPMRVYVFPTEKVSSSCPANTPLTPRPVSGRGGDGVEVPLPCIEAQNLNKGRTYEFVATYRESARHTTMEPLDAPKRKQIGGGQRRECKGMTKGVRRRMATVLMSISQPHISDSAVIALTFNPTVFEGMELEQRWALAGEKLHRFLMWLTSNDWE